MSVNVGSSGTGNEPARCLQSDLLVGLVILVQGVVETLLDDVDQDKSLGAGDSGFESRVEHEPLIIPLVDGAAV